MSFNPQPKQGKKPRKKRRNGSPFRDMILKLDPECRGCGGYRSDEAHHIKYRSDGGKDIAENGIGLCSLCHHVVHNGVGFEGQKKRHSGRAVMLEFLRMLKLENDPCYRWHAVHEELKKKVG